MISIIIPTLNEEQSISNIIPNLQARTTSEILVVDGGSKDNTPDIVESHNIPLFTCEPGRAAQMNLGASHAHGETLLFLHADTKLPADFEKMVFETLRQPNCILGAFRLKIDLSGIFVRSIEKMANLRSTFFHLPYGDQAFFIKKSNFVKCGCFPNVVFLEDFLFVRSIKKYGNIALAQGSAITSGRRWQKRGVLQTTLINQLVVIGALLGFSTRTLKKLYGGIQKG